MVTRLDFKKINRAALANIEEILQRWLPGGHLRNWEYVALNPKRNDKRLGSFKINTRTGKWSDFATGDAGPDIVSLAAYLHGISKTNAARALSHMLGQQE